MHGIQHHCYPLLYTDSAFGCRSSLKLRSFHGIKIMLSSQVQGQTWQQDPSFNGGCCMCERMDSCMSTSVIPVIDWLSTSQFRPIHLNFLLHDAAPKQSIKERVSCTQWNPKPGNLPFRILKTVETLETGSDVPLILSPARALFSTFDFLRAAQSATGSVNTIHMIDRSNDDCNRHFDCKSACFVVWSCSTC